MKKYCSSNLVLMLLFFCSFTALHGQQTAQTFVQQTQFLLSLPEGYFDDTIKKWPLLIFLHGSGERGLDVEKVKTHGPPKLIDAGKKFPFIVVSPQAVKPYSWEPDNVFHLIRFIKNAYHIDNDKVYLTGLSMGGFGTWATAMKYPQEFAAIIPICGGGDTADAWKLRHIPIRCFHGALDKSVPVERDAEMVNAVKKYNGDVLFTVYPDADHNSWERTYNQDSLYYWLLKQSKFRFTNVALPANQLADYTGRYVNENNDTATFFSDANQLKTIFGKDTFALKSSAINTFFIREDRAVDFHFERGKKNKVTGFALYEARRYHYRKLKK